MDQDNIVVTVSVKLVVSREAWTENYGVEGTNAIRQDVKTHVANGAQEHLRELGLLAVDQ